VVSRVRKGAEELPRPPAHVLAIGGHHPVVLLAANLDRPERLVRPTLPELALAGRPQVAHPVGVATAGDEVASAPNSSVGTGVLIGRPVRRPRTVSVGPPSQSMIGFTTRLMKNRVGTYGRGQGSSLLI